MTGVMSYFAYWAALPTISVANLSIVGGMPDHVHMLFQLGRTITIADAIGKIKVYIVLMGKSECTAECNAVPLASGLRHRFP